MHLLWFLYTVVWAAVSTVCSILTRGAAAPAGPPDDVFMVVEVLQEHDLAEGALYGEQKVC